MTADEVERCLDVGRDALVLLAKLVVNGDRSRGEVLSRARAEADALISLLDEAPESEQMRRSMRCATGTIRRWRRCRTSPRLGRVLVQPQCSPTSSGGSIAAATES
jgi:hypothetical protein